MKTHLVVLTGILALGASLQANTSFDFTGQSLTPGSANNGGSILSTVAGSTLTVTETAYWANVTGNGTGTESNTTTDFARTWLGAYPTSNGINYGLGVCNPNEQVGATPCSSPQHQIDNYSGLDFISFSFSAEVNLSNVKIANFGNPSTSDGSGTQDVDLSYAILSSGQEASLLAGTLAFNTVNFTTITTGVASGTTALTDTLSGSGTYLLIGAAVTPKYGDSSTATPDAFKIQGLTTTPEPASFLLIGSGLLACAFFSRRRLAAKSNA